ncbi:MAG: NAD-dependent epimerase/dehydratase family protein [Thermoleophilaceae bacterium]
MGDVTDPVAVRGALEGCDAVLHAASVYALSQRRAAEIRSVNARGTEVVLGAAEALGLDPIVHVSSYVALLPPPADGVLTADAPVGHPAGPYARSKADSESIARRFQQRGAPVTITQPGAIWGPHDPHMGESARIAMMILRGRMPIALPGPMAIVDVRDVANVHAAVMQRGQGPRRFLLVAADVMFADLIGMVRRVTGRRLPAVGVPKALARRAIGARRSVPGELEGPWFAMQGARSDSSETEAAFGIRLRPPEESVTDTVRWLHASGKLDDRRAGRVARAAA